MKVSGTVGDPKSSPVNRRSPMIQGVPKKRPFDGPLRALRVD